MRYRDKNVYILYTDGVMDRGLTGKQEKWIIYVFSALLCLFFGLAYAFGRGEDNVPTEAQKPLCTSDADCFEKFPDSAPF